MKTAVIYWSKTGNTEKVANAICDSLKCEGNEVECLRVDDAMDLDYYEYDLLCVGCPSYMFYPPPAMAEFLKKHMHRYHRAGKVIFGAPRLDQKHALVFCTYAGTHTGIDEAIPVGKYMGQFFEHLGISVIDEIYVIGEHEIEEYSLKGRLGDIRGRPNDDDIDDVKQRIKSLLQTLK